MNDMQKRNAYIYTLSPNLNLAHAEDWDKEEIRDMNDLNYL
jgi:hypothetical protein